MGKAVWLSLVIYWSITDEFVRFTTNFFLVTEFLFIEQVHDIFINKDITLQNCLAISYEWTCYCSCWWNMTKSTPYNAVRMSPIVLKGPMWRIQDASLLNMMCFIDSTEIVLSMISVLIPRDNLCHSEWWMKTVKSRLHFIFHLNVIWTLKKQQVKWNGTKYKMLDVQLLCKSIQQMKTKRDSEKLRKLFFFPDPAGHVFEITTVRPAHWSLQAHLVLYNAKK